MFCREARIRIENTFNNLFTDYDDAAYKLVQNLMKGEYDWFEGQLVQPIVPTPEELETIVAKMAK